MCQRMTVQSSCNQDNTKVHLHARLAFNTQTGKYHNSLYASNFDIYNRVFVPCWLLLITLVHVVQGYFIGLGLFLMSPASNINQ